MIKLTFTKLSKYQQLAKLDGRHLMEDVTSSSLRRKLGMMQRHIVSQKGLVDIKIYFKMYYGKSQGHLASIHSDEEKDFVVGLHVDDSIITWLGGKRDPVNPVNTDGTHNFFWTDGTPWEYDYWEDGEPNNVGEVEDCVQMYEFDDDHHWNDLNCIEVKTFVCKKGIIFIKVPAK